MAQSVGSKHSRGFTLSFAFFTFLFIVIGLIAYYGVQYARDLRSRAGVTEELTSEMRVLTRSDVMNQDGVQLDTPSTNESWLGTGRNQRQSYLGLRFTGLALPADATIVSAKLEVVSSQDQNGGLDVALYGERNNAPDEFSRRNPPSRRRVTGAHVDLHENGRWDKDTTYAFDVTTIIQELYGNVQPTDKITFIIRGSGGRNQKRFVYNSLASDKTPTLTITYTLPQATAEPTIAPEGTILDVLQAPFRRRRPTPTPTPTVTPQPSPTLVPTATPIPSIKPSPTPCPYPPDDPKCGASSQPTATIAPYVPAPKAPVSPTSCPYAPDDPRCAL